MTPPMDANWFAPQYLELLSFRRRRPTSRRQFPPATLVRMPDDAVDCVDLWAEVLRALGWLRIGFLGAESVDPDFVRASVTPRSRFDHWEQHSFPLAEGAKGVLDHLQSQHLGQLHWMRERFLALDAAPSPLYLFRTDASGRRREARNGLLLLTPAQRRAVLERVLEGAPHSFSARVPRCTNVALPFEGVGFLAGVLVRVRLERDDGSVIVHALEVTTRPPPTVPTARQAVLPAGVPRTR